MVNSKLSQVSEKFLKIIKADNHYSQVKALHNAAHNLLKAVSLAKKQDGSVDSNVAKLAGNIGALANRLLYNANYYGLSEATSKKYLDSIANYNAELLSHVVFEDQSKAIYNLANQAANQVRAAIRGFEPVAMPAQFPKKDEEKPVLRKDLGPKENPLAQTEKRLQEERSGLVGGDTIGVGKSTETIPAPPGSGYSRIPAVPQAAPTGVAMPKEEEKPFDWGTPKPPPARLAPPVKLPLTEREQELEPWLMKEQSARIRFLLKLSSK